MQIKIQPHQSKPAVTLIVDDIQDNARDQASCQVSLLNEDGQLTEKPSRVLVSGDDYTNWGGTNAELCAFVCKVRGITASQI